MDSIFVVCIWLSITFAAGKAKSTANEVFAISGCNAELEWTLGKTYIDFFTCSLTVFNANGRKIAQKEDTTCKNVIDSSVYCEARNTSGEEWNFFVVLINVTQANSGKYTGQIQSGRNYEANITTDLNVIDKPRIAQLRKPVLYESFSLMCITSYTSDCITYYWKINGSDLQDSINIHATMSTLTYRNVTMMDNFSTLTCRAGIEKCSNILCNSSEDSDPYTVKLYFTTIHSNIHIDDTGHRELLHWIGPVFFVAAFLIFVTVWRIKASREIENSRKHQAGAEQADSEVSRANTLTNSRALPCPPVQKDLFRRTNRLDYPKLQRHFRSLEKLSDQDKDVCNQKRENMCLQTLSHSSNILNRQIRDDFTKIKSTSEKDNLPYSIEGSPKGSRLLKRFARTKTSGMINKDYHETGTNSQPLISLQRSHDGSKLQEDPYNTIDENVLTVYDYSTYNAIEETSQETERRPEHRMYYYASSSDVYDVETADVHATDENYLNPISDLAHSSETCQLDETDMNGIDKKYITIIDDFSRPVEETNVTKADPTYITPITESQ